MKLLRTHRDESPDPAQFKLKAITLTADTLDEERVLARFYTDLRNSGRATLDLPSVKKRILKK